MNFENESLKFGMCIQYFLERECPKFQVDRFLDLEIPKFIESLSIHHQCNLRNSHVSVITARNEQMSSKLMV